MVAHLNKNLGNQLNDRFLWFDGDSSYPPEHIENILMKQNSTSGIFVDFINNEIVNYNKLVPVSQKIKVKDDINTISDKWNIPEYYKELNLKEYFLDKLRHYNLSNNELKVRIKRVLFELKHFEQNDMILRVLIYVINTLHSNNCVWGVGRGSSVSSYLLFLIGVHDVDSVKYNLDFYEFFHD